MYEFKNLRSSFATTQKFITHGLVIQVFNFLDWPKADYEFVGHIFNGISHYSLAR